MKTKQTVIERVYHRSAYVIFRFFHANGLVHVTNFYHVFSFHYRVHCRHRYHNHHSHYHHQCGGQQAVRGFRKLFPHQYPWRRNVENLLWIVAGTVTRVVTMASGHHSMVVSHIVSLKYCLVRVHAQNQGVILFKMVRNWWKCVYTEWSTRDNFTVGDNCWITIQWSFNVWY